MAGEVAVSNVSRLQAVSTSQPCAHQRALSGVHAAAKPAPRLRLGRWRGRAMLGRAESLSPQAASSYSMPNLETRTLFKRRFREPRQTVLFYCPEMADLAKRIAQENDSITLGEIKWEKFKDGFPNLFVQDAGSIRGIHVAFLASFHCASVIFEQMSIIYALPKMFVASFTLVLPFFPTGTLERVENEGEIATAFTLARILSNTPLSRSGPAELVIFDIHALQERFYFGDLVQPNFQSGLPLLLRTLQNLPDGMNVVVAYPDEGAWKRFHWQLRAFSQGQQEVICTKVREGDQRIVKLKEGDPKGRHVVIVDDLVQSGSTLIECQKMLAERGAAKVSAYVTHGVFPEDSWKRFVPEKGGGAKEGFTHFWITDSIPTTVAKVQGHAPFQVLSLAKPIAAALA